MRFLTVVLAVLLVCGVVAAQQKYLVTSNQEVMPLDKKGETAAKAIVKRLQAERLGPQFADCTNQYTFGYPMDLYPPGNNFGAYHKDVLGQWYVAKAAGTIDTLFWYQYTNVGALDSTLTVRINQSVVGPDYGPGVRDYAHGINFPPPCQNWGYWVNSHDDDQHVAAFPLEATDTTWHSTIYNAPNPTRPPFGKDIWALGGFDKAVHASSINYIALVAESGTPCSLKVGQKFFISMKVSGPVGHVPNDTRTEWYAWGGAVTNTDENYPSRNWKFYEHDSGPSNCAGNPVANVKRGWVARGGFADDTLSVAAYNWWYVMTATTNVPPEIAMVDGGSPVNTASTGPQDVGVDIRDCDPTAPSLNGTVAGAWIQWSTAPTAVNGVFTAQADIPITSSIPPRYEGQIPGQFAGTTVSWRVKAIDDKGLIAYGPPQSYKITSLRNQYYYVDTSYTPVWNSIAATGTVIDTGKFFIDNAPSGHGTAPKDDGTAGPYDMGSGMKFFGNDVRYAWVSVNGALSLSNSPTDTIDVASNGFWTSSWDFPLLQRTGRTDTTHPSRLPKNFISPMWGDFIVGDTNGTYGAIRVGAGANAACEYVVEWDSVGDFDQATTSPFQDIITFRVVMNKCDNSIEYQWENIGTRHKDSLALLGMEGAADSATMAAPNPPFVFICNQTYPALLRPQTGKGMRFIAIGKLTSVAGWNLLSVATNPPSFNRTNCFPEAVSTAFAYSGKYVPTDILGNGPGYWLKYGTPSNAMVFGAPISTLPITVAKGWNMIGTITSPVSTTTIDTAVNTQVVSRYFDYSGGYHSQTTLSPGKGYWVKTNLLSGTTGTLTLHASVAQPKSGQDEIASLNSITIRDKSGRSQDLYFGSEGLLKSSVESYELPPAAPDFDARFTSGRMVETYPALISDDAKITFPISVSTDAYPLTVIYNVRGGVAGKKFVLSNGKETLGVLEGSGSLTLKNAANSLALTLGNGANVPKEFALGQNYPNPFNPTTHFVVDVPKVSDVSVVVYDLLGQKIVTLLSGQLSANSYNVTWNGTDEHGTIVPSGVYFVRMVSGDFSAVQKMMLMK
jgi:hypothetical protein